VRAYTLVGRNVTLAVLSLAVAIGGLTVSAALFPRLQGLLLTVMALGFFVVAMMLLPRLRLNAVLPLPSSPGPDAPVPAPA